MIKKLAVSIILITLLSATLMSPTAIGDDAGYPSLLNPPITVTISVSKTDVKPGETITIDYYITNESKKALYIRSVGITTFENIYGEKDGETFDFDGEAVQPGKSIKISCEYETNPHNFSVEKDKINCYLRPYIDYCYYTEKVEQGEFPKWNGMFEYNSSPYIVLSSVSSYDFSSMVDISFKAEKRDNEFIYDFFVKIQNHSDSTIRDFQIESTIGYLSSTDDFPESIAPNETVGFHMFYDYYNEDYPYSALQPEGKEYVALYLYVNRYNVDNIIYEISNIQSLNFPGMELQLEAEVTCDVIKAYYNDEIPYTVAIYNPTSNTYNDIEIGRDDEFITIGPKETIYVDTTKKIWFSEYDMNIFEGFNESIVLRPSLSLTYNDCTYYYGDWCTNYNDDDFPVVNILMPPQTQDMITKIQTCDSKEYILYYTNSSNENINIDILGCVENGYVNEYPNIVFLSDNNGWFSFTPGDNECIEDTDGNKFLELIITGTGEETGNLYWVHDTFPIVSAVSTPRPTPEPTPAPTETPAPTPKIELTDKPTVTPLTTPEVMIELLSEAGSNSKTANILLTINNSAKKHITDVNISDQNGNFLCEFKQINVTHISTIELEVKNENEIFLVVEYTQNGETHIVKTGSIIKLTPEENEISKESAVLPIAAFSIFIALTVIVILLLRIKRNKDTFE